MYFTINENRKNGKLYVLVCHSERKYGDKNPATDKLSIGSYDQSTQSFVPSNNVIQSIAKYLNGNEKKLFNDIVINSLTAENVTMDEIINSSVESTTKSLANNILLHQISSDTGLFKALMHAFGANTDQILSLPYYILQTGNALHKFKYWHRDTVHPYGKNMPSPRISEFLYSLSIDDVNKFLSSWGQLYLPDEILYIDITSISLYSSEIEGADFGYNRDGENLHQINICLLLGKKCGMPLMFRVLPGKINDVASLITTLRHSFALGAKKLFLILGRGFFSIKNIVYMLDNNVGFIISVSSHISWIDKIIDTLFDDLKFHKIYDSLDVPYNDNWTE
ncbi:MAG: hypothetical protein LBR80_14005 [Deltaproteobacteria bacterium]|jgi:hypothetical protein|nr:hypothetical protein [Deltaproteobacteria bacterium]